MVEAPPEGRSEDDEPALSRAFAAVKRRWRDGTLISLAACLLLYIFLRAFGHAQSGPWQHVSDFLLVVIGVVVGLLLTPNIAYLISTAKSEFTNEVKSVTSTLMTAQTQSYGDIRVWPGVQHVDWDAHFRKSMSVVIVARFFDNPMTSHDAMIEFFKKGGEMTVLIPDRFDAAAMAVGDAQWNASDDVYTQSLAERLKVSLKNVARSMRNAGHDGLKVYFLPFAPNYAAYCFDSETLIISPYELAMNPVARAPLLQLTLSRAPAFRAFWESETTYFTRGSAGKTIGEVLAPGE